MYLFFHDLNILIDEKSNRTEQQNLIKEAFTPQKRKKEEEEGNNELPHKIDNLGGYRSELENMPLDLTCNVSNAHEDQQKSAQMCDGTVHQQVVIKTRSRSSSITSKKRSCSTVSIQIPFEY